jgi:hypothetical protein
MKLKRFEQLNESKSSRPDGFYWLKLDNEWTIGEFKGFWDDGVENVYPWVIMGSDEAYRDDTFLEIGEKIERK